MYAKVNKNKRQRVKFPQLIKHNYVEEDSKNN